jgi:Roadblock/LC7 domain.
MDSTLERVSKNSTVRVLVSYDENGRILHSTLTDAARTQIYRNTFRSLCYAARKTVKNLDPSDELECIRMRANDSIEMILAPDVNGTLVVLQAVPHYEPPYRPPKREICGHRWPATSSRNSNIVVPWDTNISQPKEANDMGNDLEI